MCTIAPVVSTVKRWVLIILWNICESYESCTMVKMTTCKFTCKDVYFCYFIEQQPDSPTVREFFPELCMAYIAGYRDFSLAFSLDFLDLATFLRQIFLFFCQFSFLSRQKKTQAIFLWLTPFCITYFSILLFLIPISVKYLLFLRCQIGTSKFLLLLL